jgi:hypothetical protein
MGEIAMKSQLIVMLTNNDVTVPNALELFEQAKLLPVKFWGFKDLGLDIPQMKELIGRMKAAEKTTFLESVCYREDECLQAAEIAVECGVDYLTGTIFYDSILERLKGSPVKYYPFFGKISGHPVILEGEIEEIVNHGKELQAKGVDGLDLVAYRYRQSAQIVQLVRACTEQFDIPLISAGSINGWPRLEETILSGIWAFTIGSAFFEKAFVSGASFNDQIMAVWRKL